MAFSVTDDFTGGTTAVASEVNQNFADVEGEINGTTDTATNSIHPLKIATISKNGPVAGSWQAGGVGTLKNVNNWTMTPDSGSMMIFGVRAEVELMSVEANNEARGKVIITDSNGSTALLIPQNEDGYWSHTDDGVWEGQVGEIPGHIQRTTAGQEYVTDNTLMLCGSVGVTLYVGAFTEGSAWAKNFRLQMMYGDEFINTDSKWTDIDA